MNDQPVDPIQPAESGRSSRTPIIVGVSVLVAGVLGVGAYAGMQLMGGGSQPAEALPDSVVAYAAIDIDPGAKQKIEAVRTLRKFPDLRKELKLEEDDDLRKRLFDEAVKGTDCEGKVSFAKDVSPWLGDRAAVAAADLGGDEPSPIFALQVSDEDAAKKTIESLRECAAEATSSDDFSYGFNEGYLVVSDGKDNAEKLIKDAAKGTLADDKGYAEWTDKAGGDGIVSFYVSQKAAELLVDMVPPEVAGQAGDMDAALKEFKGMAGAVRFADAGLELELAAKGGKDLVGGKSLGSPLTELPKDTAVAIGVGVPEDFASTLVKQVEDALGGGSDSLISQAEAQTGLDLPEDLETLLGEAALLVLGGDAPENMASTSGPSDVPFGLKIIGDGDKIEAVVAKAEERAGAKLSEAGIVQSNEGDVFVLASNDDYAKDLAKKGSLGDNENFTDVVPEADTSSFAMFVDFDSDWIKTIINTVKDAGASPETVAQVEDNTDPLGALGISSWRDGDVSHVLVKLTTD